MLGLFLTAAVAVAPAPAAVKAGGPPITFQTQSVDQLLKTARSVVKIVAGDGPADMMDAELKKALGEKGFAGLDTTRPLAGYVYLPEKMPQQPEDFKGFAGVLVLPTTGAAEFKELLARISPSDPIKLVPLKGNDGLYAVESEKGGEPDVPVRLRLIDKLAYLGVNVPDEALAADKVLKPADLVDPKETAVIAAKMFNDRYPKAWTDGAMKQFEELAKQLEEGAGNDPAKESWGKLFLAYAKWGQKLSTQMYTEGKEGGFRLKFDEGSGEVGMESYTVPKPGTPLAAQLAARKPSRNQFAGLLAKDAVGSFALQIPMMDDDFRAVLTGLVDQGEQRLDAAPEPFRPLAKEAYAGLRRTIKGESIDAVWVVSGPDKKGHFAVVQCVTFADAAPLEKALKEAVRKSGDAKVKDMFKFDVDKAGDVNLHQLLLPDSGPGEGFKRVFGSAEVYAAFGPNGIYLAMGERAKEAVAAALATKPAAAHPFELSVNPKRLADLISKVDENAGGMAKQVLAGDDKLSPAVYFGVDGGERLTFRFAVNLKLVVRPIAMAVGGIR